MSDSDQRNMPALQASPFYLAYEFERAAREVLEKHLKPFGMTLRDYNIFSIIADSENVTQKQICEALEADTGLVSRALNPLVAKGYVKETIIERGRKTYSITPEGEKIFEEAINAGATLLQPLTPDERRQFLSMMAKIAEAFPKLFS